MLGVGHASNRDRWMRPGLLTHPVERCVLTDLLVGVGPGTSLEVSVRLNRLAPGSVDRPVARQGQQSTVEAIVGSTMQRSRGSCDMASDNLSNRRPLGRWAGSAVVTHTAHMCCDVRMNDQRRTQSPFTSESYHAGPKYPHPSMPS